MKDQTSLQTALDIIAMIGFLFGVGCLRGFLEFKMNQRKERLAIEEAIEEQLLDRPRLVPRPKLRFPGIL